MVLYNTLYDELEQIDQPVEGDPGYPSPVGPPGVPGPGGVKPPLSPIDTGGPGGHNGPGGNGLSGRPTFRFGPVPVFEPPVFNRPTFEEAMNEPGYQFRLQGGSTALERSAAAGGLLRSGGTLKDLVEYGQNFATQEYGNVFNRALAAYDRDYRGAHDAFAPRMTEWSTLSNAELQAALAAYNREWQIYALNHQNQGAPQIEPEPQP